MYSFLARALVHIGGEGLLGLVLHKNHGGSGLVGQNGGQSVEVKSVDGAREEQTARVCGLNLGVAQVEEGQELVLEDLGRLVEFGHHLAEALAEELALEVVLEHGVQQGELLLDARDEAPPYHLAELVPEYAVHHALRHNLVVEAGWADVEDADDVLESLYYFLIVC